MGKILRQFSLCAISVACLNSLGCLYVPYCLPELDRIAAMQVPWPSDDVHVFRVDGIANSWQRTALMIGDAPAGGADETLELTRLTPSERKTIASQWKIGLERGWVCVGAVNCVSSSTKKTVSLRFYRRGYETITVKPGDEQKDFEWKAAANLTGQEKAVDDLIDSRERTHMLLGYNANSTAAPGGVSPAHRESLLYCAGEYDHVASFVSDKELGAEKIRIRLAEKAKFLRSLADQPK